ncbi:hypothetical protein AQUCO_00600152v1 [Aquilegia coerulea]|uniref:Uncharacterized protein n=1 Tax=Aquilegia coerulea TaxID=218851 RepID=A0A2G5ENB2_AQUCA|nr:hypothetical protein AQUCO_00600152v1 [Aquilegia coerulea]
MFERVGSMSELFCCPDMSNSDTLAWKEVSVLHRHKLNGSNFIGTLQDLTYDSVTEVENIFVYVRRNSSDV